MSCLAAARSQCPKWRAPTRSRLRGRRPSISRSQIIADLAGAGAGDSTRRPIEAAERPPATGRRFVCKFLLFPPQALQSAAARDFASLTGSAALHNFIVNNNANTMAAIAPAFGAIRGSD
jgi:hypothetical protein